MKNLDSGTDLPDSVPPAQDGPDELCWTAGTNTSLAAAGAGVQERRVLCHRARRQDRVLLALAGEDRGRSTDISGEDVVPQAARATTRCADVAVANDVLLVAEGLDGAADLAVGDEPTAGEVVRSRSSPARRCCR